MENNNLAYRVCVLKQDFKPWGEDGKTPAFEICGCCGVDFGSSKKSVNEFLLQTTALAGSTERKPMFLFMTCREISLVFSIIRDARL